MAKNPFSMFKPRTKKVVIKALDNAEVTITQSSVGSVTDFQVTLFKNMKEDGTPDISFEELAELKFKKVSLAMVSPSMSVEDLKALSANAIAAIDEISDAIDAFDAEASEE